MPFKLNFSPGKPFVLANHALIRIQGIDAAAFLQAQCMNDVNQLGDGDWQYNGWLNPQGRVMALFYLARASIDDFCMIVPELPAEPLRVSLERFKFRSKVSLSVDSSRRANGTMLPANSGHPASAPEAETREAMTLRIPGRLADRILSIAPTAAAEDPEAMDQWHCLDMAAGWIWLSGSLQNRWTPQMLSLDRLHAFSLKKGCYPGQEIVARTHYLGKSKRQLQPVCGTGLQIDQSLSAGGQEFGVVVNRNASGSYAVAVIQADAPPEPWSTACGTAVSPVAD
jgi:folate-binding protein YgfZ